MSPSRSCGPICRGWRGRWSNGRPRCIACPTCRASCIARQKPRSRRRPAPCFCRCRATSSTPKRSSSFPPRPGSRRGCAATARRSRRRPCFWRKPSGRCSLRATRSRRAAPTPSSSSWRSSSVRRYSPRASPTPRRFRPRIRCSRARWCAWRRGCGTRSRSTTCCSRSAAISLSLPSPVEPVPEKLKIVHFDVDPWELGKNHPAEVAILGDPKASLPEISVAVRERMTSGARMRARERLDAAARAIAVAREDLRAKARDASDRRPVEATALLHAIGEMLPRDAIVIDEAISSNRGMRELIRSDDEQSFFGLRGGGIGWGLPAAIGVKLALPDRPVVGLIGDGSAMYTCQALWTAAHDRIPVVFVIFNNRSYRILKQRLHAQRGHAAQVDTYVGMELIDPPIDFVGMARALGIAAERTHTVHDTTDLLAKGLAGDTAMLIDVELDRGFKPM